MTRMLLAAAGALTAILTIGSAAAEPAPGAKPGMEHDHDTHHRMEMMEACRQMPGRAPMRGGMMPQLPPGNEKLQLQMHAEMMQKMGEIMAKYANQVKEPK